MLVILLYNFKESLEMKASRVEQEHLLHITLLMHRQLVF